MSRALVATGLALLLAAGPGAACQEGREREEETPEERDASPETPPEEAEPSAGEEASGPEEKDEPEAEAEAEEKEKEKEKEKPRVYTNEDLETAGQGGGNVTSPVIEGLPRQAPRRSGGGEAGGDGLSEAQWRRRAAEARERIEKAEDRVEALEQQVVELRQDRDTTAGVLSPNREQERQARLGEAREELEEAEAEVEAAREAFEELRREARRAGVPPGWLR